MQFERLVFHTHDGFIKPDEAPSVLTVARCLMRETRFSGNSPIWWNVGLHSFVVAEMLPRELKFHGLVHDEPECITGDIPHDLKTKEQRAFEDMLMLRFYHSIGVTPPTPEQHKLVKSADRLAARAEIYADCGTSCLKRLFPNSDWAGTVRYYSKKYSYADCLDLDGAAVLEFVRRYDLYKNYLES